MGLADGLARNRTTEKVVKVVSVGPWVGFGPNLTGMPNRGWSRDQGFMGEAISDELASGWLVPMKRAIAK